MTDPDNVRQIVELNPDLLGFIFVPGSPRFIGDESRALEVVREVPRSIAKVGVFRDALVDELVHTARLLNLEVIQLHGAEDEQYVTALKTELPASVKVWKAVSLRDDLKGAITKVPHSADLVLLDGPRPGSGQRFDWSLLLKDTPIEKPFMVAGGIGPENISEARRLFDAQPHCIGVDLNSQVESASGIKDVERVRICIEAIRV
jgi:phosphoribosylanthranilate isomerase